MRTDDMGARVEGENIAYEGGLLSCCKAEQEDCRADWANTPCRVTMLAI